MKTALITGACINTGVAIVEKFASEGWNGIAAIGSTASRSISTILTGMYSPPT